MENVITCDSGTVETAQPSTAYRWQETSARILITAERKVMVAMVLRITRARRF